MYSKLRKIATICLACAIVWAVYNPTLIGSKVEAGVEIANANMEYIKSVLVKLTAISPWLVIMLAKDLVRAVKAAIVIAICVVAFIYVCSLHGIILM